MVYPAQADDLARLHRLRYRGRKISASFGFATPIGYQCNLMVYGPGGYTFGDFLKIGVPLNILMGIVASIVIPLVYGL